MDIKNTIPQIIHQIQEENDTSQLSVYLSALYDTWILKHPLWQYKLWSLQDVKTLIQNNFPDLFKYNVNDEFLLRVARNFILYSEGGVFVDSDFKCIQPFDHLIEDVSFSLFTDPHDINNQILSDSIVISKKEHPFLKFIISHLKENLEHCIEIAGNTFINEMFCKYSAKDEISILPFSIGNPCTRYEIKICEHQLFLKDYIQEKASKAYAICYYKKEKRNKGRIMPKRLTDVLYISTSVGCVGGAFNAGYRIHMGLRKIGLRSKMLVLNSGMTANRNIFDEVHIASREKDEICGYDRDMLPLQVYPQYSISTHGFSPAVVGIDLIKNIEQFNPKIVVLHGINGGFVTIEDIGRIQGKVIWRLPDCWAFTGGCYYYGDCKRYLTECGKCPKLGSIDDNDLSYEIWKRKEEAWKKIDMTVVVPTLWMKNVVENSVLLKDKEVHVIPNGLDLELYYPVNKQIARKALKISLNKKIILFGAINAFDPRKGFQFLLKALRILSEKHKDEYYFVVFGADTQVLDLDIPTKFLGYIRDQYILQLAYSAADVMIVPSLEEAFGQTVTEAMACATPVISFLGTGPESIIEHKKTGYLARYVDERDLSEGIEWSLSSRELIDELSNNARICIEKKYDIKIIARQYEELFNQLLSK
ncbi:glycosyltransferase [Bacteroides sp.]|uniref:glycosyltransferase n=1 Tax=Bacteroides sp. TaxID=29523 RepID=UPI00262DB376|nr:glycosyltransferase [Bacteroides sp.]MDD3038223.1 glycosyltransferase [Bacteroides sp.]